MARGTRWAIGLLAALQAGSGAVGCAAAAGAAASAGASKAVEFEYTRRGAQSDVRGNLDNVKQRAEKVFEEQGIAVTESKGSGSERVLRGTQGDLVITVTMDEASKDLTSVQVTAQKNPVMWDKDYARQILQDIVRAA